MQIPPSLEFICGKLENQMIASDFLFRYYKKASKLALLIPCPSGDGLSNKVKKRRKALYRYKQKKDLT